MKDLRLTKRMIDEIELIFFKYAYEDIDIQTLKGGFEDLLDGFSSQK